jgi:hypothetical protein
MPSPDGAKTTSAGVVLLDDDFNAWRLNAQPGKGHVVQWQKAGTDAWQNAGTSYDVSGLEKWQSTAYQWVSGREPHDEWFEWIHTTQNWRPAPGDPSSAPIEPPIGNGDYAIRDGKIWQPDGSRFHGLGFCLIDMQCHVTVTGPECRPLLRDFPQTKFIHLMPWGFIDGAWTWPDVLAQTVEWLTAKGIVCQIGNWFTWPVVPTGSGLDVECNWYRDLANRYKANNRVWFSTCNEPQDVYVGLPAGSVTAEHNAVYDAIRGTGSNALIGLVPIGGTTANGLDLSRYGHMHRVILDSHYYNWLAGYSNDLEHNKQTLRNTIADQRRIVSADGILPSIVGEFGNATDGAHVDAGGWATVQAALDVGNDEESGTGAFCLPFWLYSMGGQPGADHIYEQPELNVLTSYGAQVQTDFAQTSVDVSAAPVTAVPMSAERSAEWAAVRAKVAEALRAKRDAAS